ncbi:hypothetical protein LINPERHAP1_LOCUS380, partial [Linum perenne]
ISHHRPLAPVDIYGEEVRSIGNIVVLSTAPTPPCSHSLFASLPARFLGCFRLLLPPFFGFSSLPRSFLATLLAISQSGLSDSLCLILFSFCLIHPPALLWRYDF